MRSAEGRPQQVWQHDNYNSIEQHDNYIGIEQLPELVATLHAALISCQKLYSIAYLNIGEQMPHANRSI